MRWACRRFFEQVSVMPHGQHGLADQIDDLETGPLVQLGQLPGRISVNLKLLVRVAGQPMGSAVAQEAGRFVQATALQVIIQRRKAVVVGSDQRSSDRQAPANLLERLERHSRAADGLSESDGQSEGLGGQLRKIAQVGGHETGPMIQPQFGELAPGLIEHGPGNIHAGHVKAALGQPQGPLAGAAA